MLCSICATKHMQTKPFRGTFTYYHPKHNHRPCLLNDAEVVDGSFQSKWDFDINEDYLAGRSDSSVYHAVPKPRPGFKENGVNRQVDFSPRYYQISLHKEDANASKHCEDTRQLPKISYTAPLKSNDLYKQRLLEIKRRRGSSEEPIKDFKVSMHCSCKDDDRVKLARDHLSHYDHPYKNPKPHDFRPDNIIMLEKPKMRFLSTPDPGRICLHSRSSYSRPLSTTSTVRSEASTFITKSTPCTKYSKDLYFNKGRYSPAFSAYNVYLDRILINIEH